MSELLDSSSLSRPAHCLYAPAGKSTLIFTDRLTNRSTGLLEVEELALFRIGPPGASSSAVPESDQGANLVTPSALTSDPITVSLTQLAAGTYLVAPIPYLPNASVDLLTLAST